MTPADTNSPGPDRHPSTIHVHDSLPFFNSHQLTFHTVTFPLLSKMYAKYHMISVAAPSTHHPISVPKKREEAPRGALSWRADRAGKDPLVNIVMTIFPVSCHSLGAKSFPQPLPLLSTSIHNYPQLHSRKLTVCPCKMGG